jgi:hypothetical protein
MLPPKRLESLLSQAVELQQERCTYHVKPGKLSLDDVSLLKDHACTKYVNCFALESQIFRRIYISSFSLDKHFLVLLYKL